MTNYFLIYDNCCFYEIVLLGYFMKYSAAGEQPCAYCMAGGNEESGGSLTANTAEIRTAEGFVVKPDIFIKDINPEDARSLIIPGGDIRCAGGEELKEFLLALSQRGAAIGAICAGVDLLEEIGLLEGRSSIRTSSALAVRDGQLITARPNGYVDFAVEMGKALGLFTDEDDIQETMDFFKYHKSVE